MEQHTMDIVVASTWFTILTYAVIANVLLVVLIISSTETRTLTSYWIVISFSLSEIGMAMTALFHVVPFVLLHEAFSKNESTGDFLLLSGYHSFWAVSLMHLVLMTINRFACILYPTYYSIIFSKANTICLLIPCYFLGAILSIPTLFPCCYILLDSYNYVSYYIDQNSWYTYVDVVINAVVLIITTTSYAAVLNKIRTFRGQSQLHDNDPQSTNEQSSKLEVRLLIQFLAGSLIYLLTWITWLWLPRLSPSKWMFFVMMSFSFSNNAMNPTIYLICNKSLREKLCQMLGHRWHKWHKTTAVTILTRSQTGRS